MPSINVKPNSPANTHQLSLSGAGRLFGIHLKGGAQSIIESPVSPSNIQVSGGGKKFGDWDPSFSHIEIRDWEGGRGNEFYSDDPSAYYDGYGWTLSPGVWHQAPQWVFGENFTPSDNYMPGAQHSVVGHSVQWAHLASTQHYARSFAQQGTTYTGTQVQMWIRRIGRPPAQLNVRTISSASNRPASSAAGIVASTALQSTAVEELESFVWTAVLSTGIDQTASTAVNWWVEVFTSVAGTEANHWEIAYNSSAATDSTAM